MPHEVETMVSARELPWHRLGVVTPDVMSAAEAYELSGLNWTVELEPVWVGGEDADTLIVAEDKFGTVRYKDGKPDSVLGIVGPQYTPIQNTEMFAFAEALLDDGRAHYESAGSLRKGRTVFALVKLDKDVTIDGDEHVPYLLLANSHDGSSAFRALTTPVRVVCMNTLRLAITKAKTSWWIRHTATATQRVQAARESLEMSFTFYDEFQVAAAKLIDTAITDDKFGQIVEQLMPMPKDPTDRQITSVQNRRSEVQSIYANDPHNGSRWGAINAFNEYELWVKPRGDSLERQALNVLGDNLTLSNRAVKTLALKS